MRIRSAHFSIVRYPAGSNRLRSGTGDGAEGAGVELTQNGRPLPNASKAVVWLTPVGAIVEPPRQKASEIPRLVQKNKMFHPSLLVIPVGGKVEFPNRDPFFTQRILAL